jgi:hypothetical protein
VYNESINIQTRPHVLFKFNNAYIAGDVDWFIDLSIVTTGPKLVFYANDDNHNVFDTGIGGDIRIHGQNISAAYVQAALELINIGVVGSVVQFSDTASSPYLVSLYVDTSVVNNIISSVSGNEIILHAWNADTSNIYAIGGVNGNVALYKLNGVKFIGDVISTYVGSITTGTWFNVEFNTLQTNDFTGSTIAISSD